MRGAFVALTIGGILAYAGIKGLSVLEVLAGEKGRTLDPRGGTVNIGIAGGTGAAGPGNLRSGGGWGGTKAIADSFKAIGVSNGLRVISSKRPIVNTTSGNMSDHFVGNITAYAYDLSNGSNPTPEMDATASAICAAIGVNHTGKTTVEVARNITVDGQEFRVQVLYRTYTGGNHYNHVHAGVKKL